MSKPIYEDQFYGMDRRLDSDKIPDGFSPLCVNVDLDRLSTVRKRKGTALLGVGGAKDQTVQSIIEYVNTSGNTEIHSVRNGSLYKYDTSTKTWGLLVSNIFGSKTLTDRKLYQVQSVQYKNRIYHVSGGDYLQYNSGDSTSTFVGSSDENKIKGYCLAVAQRTLFIGNVIVNGVSYPNRVYYSLFNTKTIQEGDQFWNDEETGLLASTRYFDLQGGNIQAMVNFGNRNGVYIFTDTKCYTFDVTQVESNPFGALVEVFAFGCAGNRAIRVIDGVMYWMDKQGKIWAWTGNTYKPEEISYGIDDEGLGDSVVSAIDKSADNLSKVCVFGFGRKVYFSIGNLNLDNEVMANACVKITMSQSGQRSLISIDTFPDRILCATIVSLNNNKLLAVGNSSNTLLLGSGYNDIDVNNVEIAVPAFYRTRYYDFGDPFSNKSIRSVLIKYRPQSIIDSYLTVKVAVNGSTEYQAISDKTNSITTNGFIDMHDENSNFLKQKLGKINLPISTQANLISFEFGTYDKNVSFEISSFGFKDINFKDSNTAIL